MLNNDKSENKDSEQQYNQITQITTHMHGAEIIPSTLTFGRFTVKIEFLIY